MTASDETTVRKLATGSGELRFAVQIDDDERELWFRSDAPITQRADPALPAVLLPAMQAGAPLRFHDRIDPLLLRQVPDVMGLLTSWRWWWSHLGYGTPRRIEVEAPRAAAVAPAGEAEAAFFSGGVDGFFTALEVPEISHLIYVDGLDIPIGHPSATTTRAIVAKAAERLGKPLITVETNTRDLAEESVGYLSYFGSALAAVAMLLEPHFTRVLIGSSSTYDGMPPNGSHPLLDSLWRSSAVTMVNYGSWISRVRKLERIADNEVVRSSLRVCWGAPDPALNCGRCEKCLRTMAVLEVLGVLDRFETFPPKLDPAWVAGSKLALPTSGDGWRAVRALATERGAKRELIDAIDACLATELPWVPRHDGDLYEALEQREAEIADLHRRLDEAAAARSCAEALVAELMGSNSWRVTAPLRRLRPHRRPHDA